MMDNEKNMPDLVSYLKGELTSTESEAIENELTQSASLREELESLKQTFAMLQKELVPIELSAHFRMALMETIEEKTSADESEKAQEKEHIIKLPEIRQSERHIREMKKPAASRLLEHARRSPYFAISIALHAAAVMILVSIFIQGKTGNDRPRVNVHGGRGGETGHEVVISMAPSQQFKLAAVRQRQGYGFLSKPTANPTGLTINLAQAMRDDNTVVLTTHPQFNCVVAFLTDRKGQPTSEELLKRFPGSVASQIANAALNIPQAMVGDRFAADTPLRVFNLDDRIEIWNEKRWQELQTNLTQAQNRPESGLQMATDVLALLPYREEHLL